jgi:hypothetical protein
VSGIAHASLTPTTGGASQLFTIELATGGAEFVGTIGRGLRVTSLAAIPGQSIPKPASFVLLGIGCFGLIVVLARRHRVAAA